MRGAPPGGGELRGVDRGRHRDRQEARTQAEDGSAGCAAYSAVADGESFSQDLGTEWGESRSAATAMASAPDGAGADAHHEPAASGGSERRLTPQEEIVAGEKNKTIKSLSVC